MLKIKPHLIAKYADRASPGAVMLFCAMMEHVLHKV